MKYVAFTIAVVLLITGVILVAMMQYNQNRVMAERNFIQSRGAAPVPPQFRGRIGDGI